MTRSENIVLTMCEWVQKGKPCKDLLSKSQIRGKQNSKAWKVIIGFKKVYQIEISYKIKNF